MFGGKKANTCPLLDGPCIKEKCMFWTHLLGKDPQSETPIDQFGCAIAVLPILLVENAQAIRQTAASMDKVASTSKQQSQQQANVFTALTQRLLRLPAPTKSIEQGDPNV